MKAILTGTLMEFVNYKRKDGTTQKQAIVYSGGESIKVNVPDEFISDEMTKVKLPVDIRSTQYGLMVNFFNDSDVLKK